MSPSLQEDFVSGTSEEEETCLEDSGEVHFQQPLWRPRDTFKIPPLLYQKEKDDTRFSASVLRAWDISHKTTAEVQKLLEEMALQYNSYISANKTPQVAFDLIISGLDGALQSWWTNKEKQSPGFQQTIRDSKVVFTDATEAAATHATVGQQKKDANGNPIPNMIGALTWEIADEFIGTGEDLGALYQLYLGRLRLKDMRNFENYYNLYHWLVYKMEDPLDGSYKRQFIHSLPYWFQLQLVNKNHMADWAGVTLEQIMKRSWGWLRTVCESLIVSMCNKVKLNKAITKMEKGDFKGLCAQRGLPPPFDEHKSTKRKYPKAQRYRQARSYPQTGKGQKARLRLHYKSAKIGRRLDPSRRVKQKDHQYADRRRIPDHGLAKRKGRGRDVGQRMDQPQRSYERGTRKTKCFFCKREGHYANECPQKRRTGRRSKPVGINQHDPEESDENYYAQDSVPEACQCFGKCTCINMHEAETIKTLLDSLQYTQTAEERSAIFSMVRLYAEKEAKNTESSSKKKEKEEPAAPLVMMPLPQLWKQFQKPVNAHKVTMNQDFVTRNEYNDLCYEIKECKREIQNLYVMHYHTNIVQEPEEGMPPLEMDAEYENEEDWRQEAARLKKEELMSSMMINFHSPSESMVDAMTYIIRIPIQLSKEGYQDPKNQMKALVDSGSKLNVIHPALVPVELRSKVRNLDSINTSNAKTKVKHQVEARVFLSEKVWIDVILVLFENHHGIILGTPFLAQVTPHSCIIHKSGTPTRPPQYAVKFMVDLEEFVFPFINKDSPAVLNQINVMQGHLENLKGHKALTISPAQERQIAYLQKALQEQCSENPTAFWHVHKHVVRLPYRSGFSEDEIPKRSKAIAMNPDELENCEKEINTLLEKGMISPSKSNWGCFAFYVNKHSEIVRGVPRLVVNFKPLNAALAYDSYPIPKGEIILSKLSKARIFSKFDCKSGFYQIAIHPKDRYKTGFTVPNGHYQWNVMPFGLMNAPSAFQRCMDENFKGMQKFLQVYIDDILVFSPNISEHLSHVKQFLKRCQEKGVVLSSKKMVLFQQEITFLGRKISHGRISIMDHSLQFVDKFPDQLKDKVQLQRFLGCLNYVSGFYEHCADDRKLLNQLLRKDRSVKDWTDQHTKAIRKIKAKVRNLPSLHPINEEYLKIVYTDASDEGWGGVLCQESPKQELQICKYVSGSWEDHQKKNWAATKKELAAIVHSVDKFSDFLIFRHFIVRSDCIAIAPLIKKGDHREAVIVRWLMFLSHYDFKVEHVKGIQNSLADMLSREYLQQSSEINMHEPGTSQVREMADPLLLQQYYDHTTIPPERYFQHDQGLEHPEQTLLKMMISEHEWLTWDTNYKSSWGFPWELRIFRIPERFNAHHVPQLKWIPFSLWKGARGLNFVRCQDKYIREWSPDYILHTNARAIASLMWLQKYGHIAYIIYKNREPTKRDSTIWYVFCKIAIKRFEPIHDCTEEQVKAHFYQAMEMHNYEDNFFYIMFFKNQSSPDSLSYFQQGDITPSWVIDWWSLYGIDPVQVNESRLKGAYRHSWFPSRPGRILEHLAAEKRPLDSTWAELYNTRMGTWLNVLRNLTKGPKVVWIARPRMYWRAMKEVPEGHPDWAEEFYHQVSLEDNHFQPYILASPPQPPKNYWLEYEEQTFTILMDGKYQYEQAKNREFTNVYCRYTQPEMEVFDRARDLDMVLSDTLHGYIFQSFSHQGSSMLYDTLAYAVCQQNPPQHLNQATKGQIVIKTPEQNTEAASREQAVKFMEEALFNQLSLQGASLTEDVNAQTRAVNVQHPESSRAAEVRAGKRPKVEDDPLTLALNDSIKRKDEEAEREYIASRQRREYEEEAGPSMGCNCALDPCACLRLE